MALHPESPKGGHINAPQLTDSLVQRVCEHSGLGCQVLWRMAQLVPHVPLRRRSWLDQSKMSSVADFVPTGDQKFAPSSCGVSIGIIGISAVDVVHSYWAGHVGFSLKVALDVYLEHSGPVLSDETRQALQSASKSLAPQVWTMCASGYCLREKDDDEDDDDDDDDDGNDEEEDKDEHVEDDKK